MQRNNNRRRNNINITDLIIRSRTLIYAAENAMKGLNNLINRPRIQLERIDWGLVGRLYDKLIDIFNDIMNFLIDLDDIEDDVINRRLDRNRSIDRLKILRFEIENLLDTVNDKREEFDSEYAGSTQSTWIESDVPTSGDSSIEQNNHIINFNDLQHIQNGNPPEVVFEPPPMPPEHNNDNNEPDSGSVNLDDIDDGEVPQLAPPNKRDIIYDNKGYNLFKRKNERINRLVSRLQEFYRLLHDQQLRDNTKIYDYYKKYVAEVPNPRAEDLFQDTTSLVTAWKDIIRADKVLNIIGEDILNDLLGGRDYNRLSRNEIDTLEMVLCYWSLDPYEDGMSQLGFKYLPYRGQDIDEVPEWFHRQKTVEIREFLFNLLFKMLLIPLDLNNKPRFIVQLKYFSYATGKEETKRFYLHIFTLNYIITSIFQFYGQEEVIQFEYDDSSDFAVLINDVQRLREFELITYEDFLNGVDIPETPSFTQWIYNKFEHNFGNPFINAIYGWPLKFNEASTSLRYWSNLVKERIKEFQEKYMRLNALNFIQRIQQQPQPPQPPRRGPKIPLPREAHQSAFFPFFHNTNLDLTRYQMASSRVDFIMKKDVYETNCFIYALSLTGIFTPAEIHELKLICYSRMLTLRKFVKAARLVNLCIELKKYNHKTDKYDKYTIGKGTNHIRLVLIFTHVALEERTNIKKSDIIPGFRDNNRYLMTSQLIKFMWKQNLLRPIRLAEVIGLKMTFYRAIEKDPIYQYVGDINYTESLSIKKLDHMFAQDITKPAQYNIQKVLATKELHPMLFYADFEAFTVNEFGNLPHHEAFMVCVSHDMTDDIVTLDGPDCGKLLLDYIHEQIIVCKEYYPIVYIHNLGYDIHFFAKYGIITSISKGHKMLTAEILYKGMVITFKDSYSLIPTKLDKFNELFGIEQEKEIFPYDYYISNRYYGEQSVPITDILDFMGDRWSNEEKNHFIKNVYKVNQINNPGIYDHIDLNDMDVVPFMKVNLRDYAEYYCKQDVNVLKLGIRKFRTTILSDFELDVVNFLSISSLAAGIFFNKVYSKNDDLYLVGGIVREFMSYAIHGGRVMTNSNKKWYYAGLGLADFDAVSLYPSAIARLYLITGKPKVFEPEELTMDNILHNPKYKAYVIEMIVTKVKKHRQFPLIPHYDEKNKHIVYSNEENVRVFTCDIELQDMVKFQEIEFIPIRGYYWDGDYDYTVQEVIKSIFKKRLEYKDLQNPIENIYKLILNSIYGKTIIKPHVKNVKYFKDGTEKHKKFVDKYSQDIIQMNPVYDSDIIKIDHLKPIDTHFNFSLFGIHILAMSKRIMNEVMCLAEDLGIMIYYQDTDSMHIEKDKLTILAEEYKKVYGRDLIGSNLGQFHSDFKLGKGKNVWSTEAYFLGKKAYVDKLMNELEEQGYHIRMKGVPGDAIKELAKEKYKNDVIEIYKELYNEKEVEFNLLAGYKPKFEYSKNFTIKNKDSFIRKLKFMGEKGVKNE